MREVLWEFPALECIHIYSMILMVSAIAWVDLRLFGISFGKQPISHLARTALRAAWICLGINAISGGLLFMSRATEYSANSAFQIKILLVTLAVAYHQVLLRGAGRWDGIEYFSLRTRLLGICSLLLWVGVIAASRWIAFV